MKENLALTISALAELGATIPAGVQADDTRTYHHELTVHNRHIDTPTVPAGSGGASRGQGQPDTALPEVHYRHLEQARCFNGNFPG